MLARILGVMVFLVLFAVGAIFASILLAAGAVLLWVVSVYLWWKAKRLRETAGNDIPGNGSGHTIEGEYRIEDDPDRR